MLRRLAPGDWRVLGELQWIILGTETFEEVLALLSEHLVPLFWGVAPWEFPRSRWTGARKTFRDIGVPECVHGLEHEVFNQFREDLGEHLPGRLHALAPLAILAAEHDALLALEEGGAGEAGMNVEVAVAPLGAAPAEAAAANPAMGLQEFQNMPKKNRGHRNVAQAWLSTNPRIRLVAMRLGMTPMMVHMEQKLKQSGDRWTMLQTAKMLSNSESDTIALSRDWPLLVAARGTLGQEAFESIKEQHVGAKRLDCFPAGEKTLHVSNILFKVLSRQGVRFQELSSIHNSFPFILWRLLFDPERALETIRTLCPQLRDPYSADFIEYWGLDALTKPAPLGELTLILVLSRLNTVDLENGNASIKHCLDVMSTHVELPALFRLCASRLLTKLRLQGRHRKKPPGTKDPAKPRRGRKQKKKAAERAKSGLPERRKTGKGGGGLWRAFVSRALKGTKGRRHADMRALGEQYRALTDPERQALLASAQAATERHRAGGQSFGKRAREDDTDVRNDLKRRRAEALLSGAIVPVDAQGQDRTLDNLVEVLESITSDNKAVKELNREREHQTATKVKAWRDGEGVRAWHRLVHAMPGLAPQASHFQGEATVGNQTLLSWMYPGEDVIPRAMGFLSNTPNAVQDAKDNWTDTLHKLLKHDEQPPLHAEPKKKPHAKWSDVEARTCMCGATGDAIWEMKLWLCRTLAGAFSTPENKKRLDQADVVIRLSSEPLDEEEGDVEEEDEQQEEFLQLFSY